MVLRTSQAQYVILQAGLQIHILVLASPRRGFLHLNLYKERKLAV